MQRISIVRQPAFALMLFGFFVIGFAFAEPKFATAAGSAGGSETGSKPPISSSGPGVAKGGHGNPIPRKQAGAGRSGSGVPSRRERRFMPKGNHPWISAEHNRGINRSISEPLQGDTTRLARLSTDRHKALSLAR